MAKRTILLGTVAIAIIAYGVLVVIKPRPQVVAQEPLIPVVEATVGSADMPIESRGLGSVQAFDTVTVRSRVDGEIVKVSFDEGQSVKQGDPLFTIDPRPFQAALEQAQAAQRKDAALLTEARLDLARYAALLGRGFQTRQSYDQQQASVAQYDAAVAEDQAAIDTAKLNLAYTDIRAPFDGRTGARLVDIGNLVQSTANTPLVTITAIHPIFVSFTLPQDDLDTILTQQRQAPLRVTVFDENERSLLGDGVLTLIDNQIDPDTGTIHLKARFDNSDERLWPGEFVSAHVIVTTLRNTTTVPAQAVVQGQDGPYAYVVDGDGRAQRRLLTTGVTEGGFTVIEHGLSPGEHVVTDGQYRLTEGAKTQTDPGASGHSGNPT